MRGSITGFSNLSLGGIQAHGMPILLHGVSATLVGRMLSGKMIAALLLVAMHVMVCYLTSGSIITPASRCFVQLMCRACIGYPLVTNLLYELEMLSHSSK